MLAKQVLPLMIPGPLARDARKVCFQFFFQPNKYQMCTHININLKLIFLFMLHIWNKRTLNQFIIKVNITKLASGWNNEDLQILLAFFFDIGPHQQCSGNTSVFVIRDCSQWCSGDPVTVAKKRSLGPLTCEVCAPILCAMSSSQIMNFGVQLLLQ